MKTVTMILLTMLLLSCSTVFGKESTLSLRCAKDVTQTQAVCEVAFGNKIHTYRCNTLPGNSFDWSNGEVHLDILSVRLEDCLYLGYKNINLMRLPDTTESEGEEKKHNL